MPELCTHLRAKVIAEVSIFQSNTGLYNQEKKSLKKSPLQNSANIDTQNLHASQHKLKVSKMKDSFK